MSSAVGCCQKTVVNSVWYMVYTVLKRALACRPFHLCVVLANGDGKYALYYLGLAIKPSTLSFFSAPRTRAICEPSWPSLAMPRLTSSALFICKKNISVQHQLAIQSNLLLRSLIICHLCWFSHKCLRQTEGIIGEFCKNTFLSNTSDDLDYCALATNSNSMSTHAYPHSQPYTKLTRKAGYLPKVFKAGSIPT